MNRHAEAGCSGWLVTQTLSRHLLLLGRRCQACHHHRGCQYGSQASHWEEQGDRRLPAGQVNPLQLFKMIDAQCTLCPASCHPFPFC